MKINLLLFFIAFTIFSCNGKKNTDEKPKVGDTPNSGIISISVDESLLSLLKDEVQIFENENPNAKIELVVQPESKGIQEFLENKNRAIITTRKLTEDEINFGKQNNLEPLHFFIAYDAVVFIVNGEIADSIYSVTLISDLLKGNSSTDKTVVFDNNGSGEVQYIKNKFGLQKLPANFFATNGFSELVDYVASHKNSIGVISNNNLLNDTDSVLQQNVRVISVRGNDGITYFPSDSNIRSGNYPFRREVYIACGESWPGLGTGFAKFMITDIGQTIIKRSGLIPARQAMRNIELKKDF